MRIVASGITGSVLSIGMFWLSRRALPGATSALSQHLARQVMVPLCSLEDLEQQRTCMCVWEGGREGGREGEGGRGREGGREGEGGRGGREGGRGEGGREGGGGRGGRGEGGSGRKGGKEDEQGWRKRGDSRENEGSMVEV